ncbi:MAG TPA: YdcF family protein [Candidatus Saccharimonadales bacterium]
MRKYDAAAVLGKAYDFERQRYPQHMYESLRVAAQKYESGRAMGGIAVCGAAEMKALERGQRAPTTEAEEMERYLIAELNVPASAIHVEDKSTNTPENFVNLKAIAMRWGWRQIYMPIAAPRIERAAFLGQKVGYGQCDFTMEGVAPDSDEEFRTEAKLLGDMACTLKAMAWGDHEFLLNPDGSSRWNELRLGHRACEFYVSTEAVEQGTIEPFRNFHPDELMAMHGTLMRE